MDKIIRFFSTWCCSLAGAGVWCVCLFALGACGGGGGGSANCSFFSNTCTPVLNLTGGTSPSAFVLPYQVTLQAGSTAEFRVYVLEVANPGYQWQRSSDQGRSYVDIPGATGNTFSQAVSVADNGAMFRVNVSGAAGVLLSDAGRVTVSALPPVTFLDSEFALDNWSVAAVAVPAQNGPTHAETQRQADGNPGAFRSMVHAMSADSSSLHVLHFSQAAVYAPAAQGAILAIDYSEDCYLKDRTIPTMTLDWNFAFKQAGRTFRLDGYRSCNAERWSRSQLSSLVAADFVLADGPACNAGESCPDFSAGGQPLRFGFERYSSHRLPAGTVTHGIDNWQVWVWKR